MSAPEARTKSFRRSKRRGAGRTAPSTGGHVYGYVRVSTARQADEGESLEVQQRIIEGYAMQHGLAVDRTFVERAVSGSKPLGDPDQGAAMIATLKSGDTVIAAKLDRLFRSALDALEMSTRLREAGISLHLCDLGGDINNGLGKTFFIIASAFAEAERDRIRERITEVKRDQRQRGRFLGGIPPFGWRVGERGELIEIPEQQAVIRRMQRMRAQGKTFRAIAEAVRAPGISISIMGVKKVLDAATRRAAA
jgi:putative DNA-invertase from lambdoid prophage Rac